MKKVLPLILTAVIAAGCSDGQSAQSAQVRLSQQEINKVLTQAQLPYVPDNKGGLTSRVAWRQQLQDKAQQQLQTILNQGTAAQKITSRKLSSDLYDSSARQQLIDVIHQWTELSDQSALLLGYLQAVDRANAQVQRFARSQSSLLADMNSQATELQQKSEAIQQELSQWQTKANDLSTQIGQLDQQTQKATDQAAQLREKAFSLTGKERFETYEKASKVALTANDISSKLQSAQAQLDLISSRNAILARQLELSNEAVNQIQEQMKLTQEAQQDQDRLKVRAQQEKEKAVEQLDTSLQKIVVQYKDLNEKGFAPIAEELDKAIKMLEDALPLATNNNAKRQIQLDLLARRVSKLHLLATQASASGDWARKVQVIADVVKDPARAGGPLILDKVSAYNALAEAAASQNLKIVTEALAEGSQATDVVSQIVQAGNENDPIVAQANALGTIINAYNKQINDSKL